MEKTKYLILGAGPSGLAFARKLKDFGEESFLVLEKETEAGGLCRSKMVDGSPFDIGGGHFLDVVREEVDEFLFRFLPREEWQLFNRDSRIEVKGDVIGHPFEANIWQFPLEKQVDYLESIAKAGCNGEEEKPEKFVDWIRWKLGEKIATDYMLPYNQKMFADDLDELGTYWLEKLPSVSFKETLMSCLAHKAYGKEPAHGKFYYPKNFGYGEVWLRIAESMKEQLRYEAEVAFMDVENRLVRTKDGREYQAEQIITTIPWKSIGKIQNLPKQYINGIQELKHSAVETRYQEENLDTEAQWIYYPDEELAYHRILLRHNFCGNSKGYWMETRKERVSLFRGEESSFTYLNEFAYPLNSLKKPEIMDALLSYCKTKKVYGLGRWGEHNHYNSDVTVERAMKLAEEFCKK